MTDTMQPVSSTMQRFRSGALVVDMEGVDDYHQTEEALDILAEIFDEYLGSTAWNGMLYREYLESRYGEHSERVYRFLKIKPDVLMTATRTPPQGADIALARDIIERYLASSSSAESGFELVF